MVRSGTTRLLGCAAALTLIFQAGVLFGQTAVQVPVSKIGSGSLTAVAPGSPAIGVPEVDPATVDNDADTPSSAGTSLNRSIAKGTGTGPTVPGSGNAKSSPELLLSFDGLNHFNQRFANGGNQFSDEPPDQGLCAGNGFVFESVNDALRVFDASGSALTGVIDLNTFYGYPAAINRSNGHYGPEMTDPSCYFDPDTQRWFQIVLTLDRVGTTPALNGKNHIDIAVSTTSSPLGSWIVYHLPVQNDGTDGTPNHQCGGPCLGDYPHIGADANAIFITTNEFSLFGRGFFGAQIYALPKRALTSGASNISAVLFNTGLASIPFCGFTVWPAIASDGVYAGDHGGTEFFLSSDAVCSITGTSNDIVLWSVSNTSSINSAVPALTLSGQYVSVATYGVPPLSDQKAGDYPQGQCLSDSTILTPFGLGCWRYFFAAGGPFPNVEKKVDSNDSRMQQVYFANGNCGALWIRQ